MSAFVPVQCYFYYYSFLLPLEAGDFYSSSFIFQDYSMLAVLGFVYVCVLSLSVKNCAGILKGNANL